MKLFGNELLRMATLTRIALETSRHNFCLLQNDNLDIWNQLYVHSTKNTLNLLHIAIR